MRLVCPFKKPYIKRISEKNRHPLSEQPSANVATGGFQVPFRPPRFSRGPSGSGRLRLSTVPLQGPNIPNYVLGRCPAKYHRSLNTLWVHTWYIAIFSSGVPGVPAQGHVVVFDPRAKQPRTKSLRPHKLCESATPREGSHIGNSQGSFCNMAMRQNPNRLAPSEHPNH